MPTPTETTINEIFLADPLDLRDHPLLAHMPAVRAGDPDTAAFIEAVRAAGRIEVPILVDSQGRVVDGRRRTLAARTLDLPLPALRVPDADAATTVLNALGVRRNLGKGAVAYLAYPVIKPVLAEAQRRWKEHQSGKVGHFDQSASGGVPPSSSVKMGQITDGFGTIRGICDALGISQDTLKRAERVHELFAELGDEVRADYEPRLFGPWTDTKGVANDEPQGLGHLITSLSNLRDGEDRNTDEHLDKRHDHVKQIERGFRSIFYQFDQSNPESLAKAQSTVAKLAAEWPPEKCDNFLRWMKGALKK